MNWDAIGAVGEVVGALAVVASLVFLALQIRAQNRDTRLAAMHEISESFRDSLSPLCVPEVAEVITKGNDYESLTDSEKLVVTAFYQQMLRVWEEAFLQHGQGRLATTIWDTMVKQYTSVISSSTATIVWNSRKKFYDPAFEAYVDSIPRTSYSIEGQDRSW